MVAEKDWPCWEIMKCDGTENCPARMHPKKPCWEIVRELDDFRSNFNVCRDCIVYVTKEGAEGILGEEILNILERKGVCVLVENCPHYSEGIRVKG